MLYGSYYNNVCLYLGMRYVTPCGPNKQQWYHTDICYMVRNIITYVYI